ncbi:MAG: manganese efflux pump [Anaerolineaceae bacterium]|nr:manganese efflux pump [Anaerolineaceae bacterium]
MDFITLLIISISLAMDCFAVSLGVGSGYYEKNIRTYFRVSYHFGLFQGGMAFIGWLAGQTIVEYISTVDHWIAFVLLAFVGGRMIREGLDANHDGCGRDPSRGKMLVVLCVATSIDALAVGISMAMVTVNISSAILMIGIASVLLSILGLSLGNQLGKRFGKGMEVLGGALLVGIGIRIVITHLM